MVPVRPLARVLGGLDHLGFPSGLQFVDAVLFQELATACEIAGQRLQIGSHLAGHGGCDLRFVYRVHECEQPVVVLLGDRIVLVIMALGAADGQAEPDGSDRVGAIHGLLEPELLDLHPAFPVLEAVPVESRRDPLVDSCARQDVPRDLLDRKAVKRHVAIESVDHPLAPAPGVRPLGVLLVAVGVGVASEIEPVDRPALSVVARLKKAVDEALVRARPWVRQECIDLLGRRRQSGEVQAHPS